MVIFNKIKRGYILFIASLIFIYFYNVNCYANWKQVGNLLYYEQDGKYLTGFQFLEGNLYLFSETGTFLNVFTDLPQNPKDKVLYLANKLCESKACIYTNDVKKRNIANTFDCSSFVGRVFKLCGIDFYNYYQTTINQVNGLRKNIILCNLFGNNKDDNIFKADDIYNIKVRIVRNTILPGDIVYYYNENNIVDHCGIIDKDEQGNWLVISCKKETGTVTKEYIKYKNIAYVIRVF